jgi:ubiquinol-cytochrome c reductase cytochrome c1 subunit
LKRDCIVTKRSISSLFLAAASLAAILPLGFGYAGGGAHEKELIRKDWPFEGVFGTVDRKAAQRGFQVYKEVCASCHSMQYMSYRNLADIGFSQEEVKAIAAGYQVKDGPNDDGEMFERPGRPSDRFVSPFPNEKAARASNGGAYPPDLSLIVKAREGGADYVNSLLLGYAEPPSDVHVEEGKSYNAYFPGGQISMPKPLSDGQVEYTDKSVQPTAEQMAHDVTVFLQWTAEPEMEHRKSMGVKAMLYLLVFTGLFCVAKGRIWGRLKRRR